MPGFCALHFTFFVLSPYTPSVHRSSQLPFPPGARVHLIGIGGIGMSAIAQWLKTLGVRVTGSDRASSDIVTWLQSLEIPVAVETEDAILPEDADALIYSDAVPLENSARQEARRRGIHEYAYPEALGMLSAPYKTVAISGSHGKSTTTALVALMLTAGGLDPTAVIGTRVPGLKNSNFLQGGGEIAVIEADEYRGHCLHLRPAVSVITTTDYDHVDAFPTIEAYRDVYRKFIDKTLPTGLLVLHASDPCTPEFTRLKEQRSLVTFGITDVPENGPTVAATPPVLRERRQEFTVFKDGKTYGTFTIPLPGEHLVLDALAALAAVSPWNIPVGVLQKVLAEFTGTWRRFEHVGLFHGAPVISDYAHHPTELRAVVTATKAWYPNRRLLLVFQPHQKARTRAFADKFLDVLTLRTPDVLIVSEVFDVTGREEAGDTTSTQPWVALLKERGTTVTYAPTLEAAEQEIRAQATPDDVILIVGAGTIDRVARRIVS